MVVELLDHVVKVTIYADEGVTWAGKPFAVINSRATILDQALTGEQSCNLTIDLGMETGCLLQDQQSGNVVQVGTLKPHASVRAC
jgi:hypothetical protein